jgi:hypothetical protein
MRQGRRVNSETDEDRWAEAQSLLDRTTTEPAEQRIRRWRRLMVLLIVGIVLLGLAFGVAAVAWFDGQGGGSDDGPLWREITGLVVSFVATVVLACAVVVQWRGNRRRMAWSSPLVALTRRQRKALWSEVRENGDVLPERLPLARHLAENVAGQRILVVLNCGILLLWTGQLISARSSWRLGLVVVYGAVTAVSLPWILRRERMARRFLADHPAPDDDGSVA